MASSQTELMEKINELNARYAELTKKLVLAPNKYMLEVEIRQIEEERKAWYEEQARAQQGYKANQQFTKTYKPRYISNKML